MRMSITEKSNHAEKNPRRYVTALYGISFDNMETMRTTFKESDNEGHS